VNVAGAVVLAIVVAPLGVALGLLGWSVARRTRTSAPLARDSQRSARVRVRRTEDWLLRREILLGSRAAARTGLRVTRARPSPSEPR
jgi:hypothetical protein